MTKEPRPEAAPEPKRGVLVEAANGPAIEYDETGIILRLADRVVQDLARRLGEAGEARFSDPAAPSPVALRSGTEAGLPPIPVAGPLAQTATLNVAATATASGGVTTSADARAGTAGDPTGTEAARVSRSELALLQRPDPALLGDIDAWDLAETSGFYRFQARLAGAIAEPRRYLREVAGGAILAETSGPVQAVLGFGGARFSTTWSEAPDFAQHVVGVPLAETGEAQRLATPLRNRSGESLLADAVLHRLYAARRALPLMPLVPVQAPSGHDPRPAVETLMSGFDRARALAAALGRGARVLAVRLDLGLDQAPRDGAAFHDLAVSVLDRIAQGLAERDAGRVQFLLCPDAGPWWSEPDRTTLEALHQLVLRPAGHRITVPSPAYAFAQDDLGQPTAEGAAERAVLEAEALETVRAGGEWLCPLLCLAERSGKVIRATFRSGADLVLDPADPFGAGPAAGFGLRGTRAKIASVRIAPDDPRAVLLTCDGAFEPDGSGHPLALELGFGTGAGEWTGTGEQAGTREKAGAGETAGTDAAQGHRTRAVTALRDGFAVTAPSGAQLFRWALPASAVVR